MPGSRCRKTSTVSIFNLGILNPACYRLMMSLQPWQSFNCCVFHSGAARGVAASFYFCCFIVANPERPSTQSGSVTASYRIRNLLMILESSHANQQPAPKARIIHREEEKQTPRRHSSLCVRVCGINVCVCGCRGVFPPDVFITSTALWFN